MSRFAGGFDQYQAEAGTGDLFRSASASVTEKWLTMAGGLAALSGGKAGSIQDQLGRQIQDLGMTFRMAKDEEERAWPLSPLPLIIGAEEWAGIERGLIQRAELLEHVAADIYGAQTLISGGHLPAAVVAGSRYFARKMVGVPPREDHYIHVYAVDLARGPRGQWRVLADRLRLATGIGHALENRLALSRATGSLLSDINVRRLAEFFAQMRAGIARDCLRDTPRIALLTAGHYNQSYPEQAHLARYLGFPLVEGRDLTVSDGRLYVRTIAGPKRIDALWRWIATDALDPLNFDSRSAIGVPDVFDAFAHGALEVANWPGVEVLESTAFAAFMPRLCRVALGQEPLLPNIATWWCGQRGEAEEVRRRFDELVITPAHGAPVEGIDGTNPMTAGVVGSELSGEARERLLEAMARRPMDYCGQEIVHLSTTPAMIGSQNTENSIVPRPFTLRAFVARGADGRWQVMPGGFGRLSSTGELRTSLMGEGDLSADVCVVDDRELPHHRTTTLGDSPPIRRGGGILSSQAADNLYWFGRYNERAEVTVRVLRALLGQSLDVDNGSGNDPAVKKRLVQLLVTWGAISARTARAKVPEICASAMADLKLPGGVAALVRNSQRVGLSLRDRFARDFWRIVSRPMADTRPEDARATLKLAKDLLEHFNALAGLVSENMVRSPAWCFLDTGRRIERALSICRIARALLTASAGPDAHNVLLDLCDSQIVYRSRYLTGPWRDPVLDLVLLDPDNPRSLVFQVQCIEAHIAALPALLEDNVPERPLREARAVLAPLRSMTADSFDEAKLREVETGLLALSDAISARYFLQFEKAETEQAASFLA